MDNELNDRLLKLEIRFEDRWKFHDEQAEERQKLTCKKLDDIRSDINNVSGNIHSMDKNFVGTNTLVAERFSKLPCEIHKNEMSWMKKSMYAVYTVVGGMALRIIYLWIEKK